jgi:NitT/TauT family transport system substrate-binding protein
MNALNTRPTFTSKSLKVMKRLVASVALTAPMILHPASARTDLKMILNWKFEGPQAWFFIAQDRGYFKAEGLDVTFDQGDGSAGSIPKVANGSFNVGFGDLNAVIDLASKRPAEAPVAVAMLYNVTPFALAVKTDGPIKEPKDLEGKTIGGGVNDAALKLFPMFSKLTGIDASKVHITNIAPNLEAQMLSRGQIDAGSTYVTTMVFAAKNMCMNPDKDLKFIRYGSYGIDLYSNAVFFSKPFIAEHPDAVRGFLKALNHAIKDVIADPDAGVDAVMKREPLLKRDVEREKLLATLKNDMSSPEIAKIGLGDVDDARLKRGISIVVEAMALPRTPAPSEVFDRSFLPARADRPSKTDSPRFR